MHVVFREARGLEETETPFDPGQTPADLVVLSFSDSDLGAFAAGWHRGREGLPSVRLQNLIALKHPLSVDTYAEAVLAHAKGILIRLIGGEAYWAYGLSTVQDLARRRGIALAVLPADGRPDERLDALSTLPVSTLRRLSALCEAGGAVAAQAALAQLALAAGLYAGPVAGSKEVPDCGWYDPDRGVIPAPSPGTPPPQSAPRGGGGEAPDFDGWPEVAETIGAALSPEARETHAIDRETPSGSAAEGFSDPPRIAVTFYRSYLTAADTAPVDALIRALRARGFDAFGLFAPSLKGPAAATVRQALTAFAPSAIVNATAFSAKGEDGSSPLDAPGCPVFQVALSTARRRDWQAAERGLSPADLAMHVVLPEVDGRLFAGVVSFKSPGKRDPDLQFSRFAHRADADRIEAVADRVAAWHRLSSTPAAEKRLALVLSTYPGRDWNMAHAVGLDALASAEAILEALSSPFCPAQVSRAERLGAGGWPPLSDALTESIAWPLDSYRQALATLPEGLRDRLHAAWGRPEDDPACDGAAFHFRATLRGMTLVALQPERGDVQTRADGYHDLSRTPRHAYVAFYLWLRAHGTHALVHIGAHGTLEWLPGKAVALSGDCWPEVLTGDLPVIYPFIVNDPGEAAQAKRRIGALTLGHMPPPLAATALPANLHRLERLLDEYAAADGLDPARRDRLIAAIRDEAQAAGVEADLAIPPNASPAEAIPRIDRFVCDIKESQYGAGLHVFGDAPGEMEGLMAALSGRRVAPGPSGSPYRGRTDVQPTGRNMYSVDPRAVPSRAAHAQGIRLAEELLRRHLQDQGDWPRGLVVDLWGSATMRTAGEEFAMALHLAGLAPVWDAGSDRVTGVEVVPLALLRRPRIDVTLRVSGLFRDVFPSLAQVFETGAALLADREEDPADNPYRARAPRVFAPQPGQYGLGMGKSLEDYSDEGRRAAGEAWLAASAWAIDAKGDAHHDREGLEARVRAADAFAHVQDLTETDVLVASDYAAHEGGFAAAQAALGGQASLYHIDATRAGTPRARSLTEEIARTVRARAADPGWATAMMAHGFRGGAEIAATLEHLAAFAHLTRAVPAHLIDLYHDATLGRDDLVAFLSRENPGALDALRARFAALREAGLWISRRNSLAAPEAAE
jgi:cobaltochelatase CobN